MRIVIFFFLIPFFVCCSQSIESKDVDSALFNAKKGIFWAFSNIPEKKNKIENDLIKDDRLAATVSILKEINGIKVESTGFFNSTSVKIIIFRSFEILKKEGFIKETSTLPEKE